MRLLLLFRLMDGFCSLRWRVILVLLGCMDLYDWKRRIKMLLLLVMCWKVMHGRGGIRCCIIWSVECCFVMGLNAFV